MSIATLARPEIQRLTAYQAAEQVDDTVRLNANESPHSSDSGQFRRPLNRYPEVRPQRLQTLLAARFGCAFEQLLVTRGSSEAIDLLTRSFCRAGLDSILTPSPSFSMYRHYATVQDAEVIEVAMSADTDFAIDVDALLSAATDNTRLVFVCSPNNPTGTPLPRSALLRLLEARKTQSAVVVDEAYVEFGEEASAIELLERYPNLVVLRTLSKALGFAGARCGAVIAQADVIRILNAVQTPYALATPVVECVEDALQDNQLTAANDTVNRIVRERRRLTAALENYSFVEKVWPSDANFIFLRMRNAAEVLQRCAEHRVLLRDFSAELTGCVRITVGNATENDQLLVALDTVERST